MLARWLLPLALATAAASMGASALLVDALAGIVADRLTVVASFVAPRSTAELAPLPELAEPPEILASSTQVAGSTRKKAAPAKPAPAAPKSIFVPASRVLAIAESGARPRGKPVPATARRPAGLKLSGVSALGIGLLDGDVLTEAAGAPALDSAAVIQSVLRARARRAKTISGTCYRGDARFSLVVEQPYLPPGSKPEPRP